jgi:ornithine cyclodeaminase
MISIVPEDKVASLVSRKEAFAAVESVFMAQARGSARNFPVVREATGQRGALFGFKSGVDLEGALLGVKAGGYWPNNQEFALPNHQSAILLFDPDTGRLQAIVGGNYLTGLRTAAAAAVSIARLARPDIRVLGLLGAGGQAEHQIRAAVAARSFETVLLSNRTPERAQALAERLADLQLEIRVADREAVVREADVLVTITSSFAPLIEPDWVRPGTHIAAMGTDTAGKQELPPALVAAARIFTDEPAQSASIGECQHAVSSGLVDREAIVPLGLVLNGAAPGRQSSEDITLYDGTGVALQDLAMARAALDAAVAQGLAMEVDW